MTTEVIMAWDSDDVLFPFTHAYAGFVGRDPNEPWTTYDHYFNSWGIPKDQFVADLERFVAEGHFGAVTHQPLPEAAATFNTIQNSLGVRSYVVTHKPNDDAIQQNMKWLIHHGMVPDGIVRSRDKTVIRQMFPDALIIAVDDKTENVEAMLDADIWAFLLDAPWNQTAEVPRISRLSQLVPIVQLMKDLANEG